MKPSTVAELAGFALISVAAGRVSPILGLFVAGCFFVLTGYAVEDDKTLVVLRRVSDPFKRRRAARVVKRAQRRATKAAK